MDDKILGKVVLIDDEEIVRMLLGDMLHTMGYKVYDFSDPVKAIDFYKENHDDIDLVFIDMVMPKLSGRETFFLLKKINKNVKTILLSGFSSNSDIETILNEGCLDFLKKPIKFDVLKGSLNKVFREKHCVIADPDNDLEKIKNTLGIEENHLDEALVNMGGNKELFIKMLFRFFENYSNAGNTILQLTGNGKFDDILILAHSIKSASASLGLKKLSNLAETVEKASIEKDVEKCDDASLSFNDEIASTFSKIDELTFFMSVSGKDGRDSKVVAKEIVLNGLEELSIYVKKRRPLNVNKIMSSKLKDYSCEGFDFDNRESLIKLASKYNYEKMEKMIEKIISEVKNG